MIYKLASKFWANRLKVVLSAIISNLQSAFVPGRMITDNVIIAFNALHTMITRQKDRKGSMTLKLDMGKTYDMVEWDFLEAMIRQMRFNEQWISLIMICTRTVSYAVLINGKLSRTFKPTRWIRQGDSISPYLFLMCAEGLSGLLSRAECEGQIKGIKLASGCQPLSHLFFMMTTSFFVELLFLNGRLFKQYWRNMK